MGKLERGKREERTGVAGGSLHDGGGVVHGAPALPRLQTSLLLLLLLLSPGPPRGPPTAPSATALHLLHLCHQDRQAGERPCTPTEPEVLSLGLTSPVKSFCGPPASSLWAPSPMSVPPILAPLLWVSVPPFSVPISHPGSLPLLCPRPSLWVPCPLLSGSLPAFSGSPPPSPWVPTPFSLGLRPLFLCPAPSLWVPALPLGLCPLFSGSPPPLGPLSLSFGSPPALSKFPAPPHSGSPPSFWAPGPP